MLLISPPPKRLGTLIEDGAPKAGLSPIYEVRSHGKFLGRAYGWGNDENLTTVPEIIFLPPGETAVELRPHPKGPYAGADILTLNFSHDHEIKGAPTAFWVDEDGGGPAVAEQTEVKFQDLAVTLMDARPQGADSDSLSRVFGYISTSTNAEITISPVRAAPLKQTDPSAAGVEVDFSWESTDRMNSLRQAKFGLAVNLTPLNRQTFDGMPADRFERVTKMLADVLIQSDLRHLHARRLQADASAVAALGADSIFGRRELSVVTSYPLGARIEIFALAMEHYLDGDYHQDLSEGARSTLTHIGNEIRSELERLTTQDPAPRSAALTRLLSRQNLQRLEAELTLDTLVRSARVGEAAPVFLEFLRFAIITFGGRMRVGLRTIPLFVSGYDLVRLDFGNADASVLFETEYIRETSVITSSNGFRVLKKDDIKNAEELVKQLLEKAGKQAIWTSGAGGAADRGLSFEAGRVFRDLALRMQHLRAKLRGSEEPPPAEILQKTRIETDILTMIETPFSASGEEDPLLWLASALCPPVRGGHDPDIVEAAAELFDLLLKDVDHKRGLTFWALKGYPFEIIKANPEALARMERSTNVSRTSASAVADEFFAEYVRHPEKFGDASLLTCESEDYVQHVREFISTDLAGKPEMLEKLMRAGADKGIAAVVEDIVAAISEIESLAAEMARDHGNCPVWVDTHKLSQIKALALEAPSAGDNDLVIRATIGRWIGALDELDASGAAPDISSQVLALMFRELGSHSVASQEALVRYATSRRELKKGAEEYALPKAGAVPQKIRRIEEILAQMPGAPTEAEKGAIKWLVRNLLSDNDALIMRSDDPTEAWSSIVKEMREVSAK